MSEEVKEEVLSGCDDVDDVDMCMKQIDEILAAAEETKEAIRDSYYDHKGSIGERQSYKGAVEIIQRVEMIERRIQQLETMIKFSFDAPKRNETNKTTYISPWFFMVGAMLILCRKKR